MGVKKHNWLKTQLNIVASKSKSIVNVERPGEQRLGLL